MPRSTWSQLMLVVRDVERSSSFYCDIFSFTSAHGGSEYDQLTHDGELVMQLHDRDVEDHHGMLADPEAPVGHGVLVWFEVADFEAVVAKVRATGAPIVTEVHTNPNARQQELWFRDPDGYLVVVAGPSEWRPRAVQDR